MSVSICPTMAYSSPATRRQLRSPHYKQKIAGRKTILQQVRELPDQTLAQAMARTHHDAQREGPVMLSLACDNAKFVLERDGTLRFQATTNLTERLVRDRRRDPSAVWRWPTQLRSPAASTGAGCRSRSSLRRTKGCRYSQRTFVAPCDEAGSNPARLNRRSVCVAEFTVTNTLAQPAEASLALNFLVDSRQKKAASLTRCPGGYCAADEAGPLALAATDTATRSRLRSNGSELKLNGTPAPARVRFLRRPAPGATHRPVGASHPARLRAETEAYWNAVLAPAMQVETPDPLLNNVIRSSQVRCLIAARNEADGARIAPWIAAMSYGPLESEANSVIRGMDFMGHGEFARRGLDFFIHRYNTNGFLTTGYTTFGTAWHLWTLGEHYQLYRDTNWLRQAAPEVERVAEWIVRQTEKTKRPAAPGIWPHAARRPGGLELLRLPLRHERLLLRGASRSGRRLVRPVHSRSSRRKEALAEDRRASRLRLALTHAAELRTNILRAYRWTQAQAPALPLRNGTWIPHYPSQVHSPGKLADFFPGQDGGRSWCYDVEIGAHQLVPTGVFDPRDREVERMMDHMEDVQFLSDGWFDYPATMNEKDWFNLGGFSKVQPYYTRNCEVYALRDDVKPFVRSYFNTLAAMLNPEVLTFWEHFHHSGAWDKTHETGYFLHQTRTMLVTERGDQLWLAPFITSNWLKDGQTLSVSNAPTRFGPVSYQIESHLAEGYIRATIHPPTRQAPSRIVLRLRNPEGGPIRLVRVNGKQHRDFDKDGGLVRLKPTGQTLNLEVLYR